MAADTNKAFHAGFDGIGLAARSRLAILACLAMAVILAIAIGLRCILPANTDIAWLLTVGERVLGGETLYRDVIETNPPIAVWTYIPGLLLGRLLHIRPEIVTDALVFLGVAISLGLSALILKRSRALSFRNGWTLAILAFAALTILPMQQFGQREHIAMISLLPMLAVLGLRSVGEVPPRWAVLIGGLGAGLMLAFKPHFAIALAAGLLALAIRARSPKILFVPENLVAAAVAGLYVAAILRFYPGFFTLIGPLVRDVYIPVGKSFGAMVTKTAVPIWLVLVLMTLRFNGNRHVDAPVLLLLAASAGFGAAFFLQRKGWPYHSYPMIVSAMLAVGITLAARPEDVQADRLRGRGPVIGLAIVFACAMAWFNTGSETSFLREHIARLDPHPKILALTAEPSIGHPLVRTLGGVWVSRQQALWIEGYRDFMKQNGLLGPSNEAAVDAHAAREREFLIQDIRKNPPTVVLVDNLTGEWSQWLANHPEISALLKDYAVADSVNRIDILTRKR